MSKTRSCSLLKKPITHAMTVSNYINNEKPELETELAWFSQRQPELAAIQRVALACDSSGKRLPHQCRLLTSVIPAASSRLCASSRRLFSVCSFDDLFMEVQACIGTIDGVGPLYVYDTSLRLGAFQKLWPTQVYLHAGAREGAKFLLGAISTRSVPLSLFPSDFHALLPYEMENLLCCYRECL
jgi:hypothetical protein